MLIRPHELTERMQSHGLQPGEIVGLGPKAPIPTVLRSFYQARKGAISFGEASRRMKVGQVRATLVSYMGYAHKASDQNQGFPPVRLEPCARD